MKRRLQPFALTVLVFLASMLLSLPVFSSSAHGLTISHAMCGANNWDGSNHMPILAAQVLDLSNRVVQDASVWVIGPGGARFDLEYDPPFRSYIFSGAGSVALGDYVFHAERGAETAGPVVKTLPRVTGLAIMKGVKLTPSVPRALQPLGLQWTQTTGAKGYFVILIENGSGKKVWSSAGSLWQKLSGANLVTIPGTALAPSMEYSLLILAVNSTLFENATAMTGIKLQFTPGKPFNLSTVCLTTNSYPYGKFICLQVFLEDYFGNSMDKASVWAKFPSGQTVPFAHNINGWYQPEGWPDPGSPDSYGTYSFFASYNGRQQKVSRLLKNFFLPVPKNVRVQPWPLKRGKAFGVSWDTVQGATHYRIDLDEGSTGKSLFNSPTSRQPSHSAPAQVWNSLTPGSRYEILTQTMNAERYKKASASSFYRIEFIAP